MRDRKSPWKSILIWAGVAMVLLVAIHALLIGGTNHRLEVELARIKAAGEPVTAADLAPPKIPDAVNAALVYEQAFRIAETPPINADIKPLDEFWNDNPSKKTASEWRKAERSLDAIGVYLDKLKQASAMPDCRFPVDWAKGLDATFPHLAGLRQAERVTSAAAVVEAHRGNAPNSVDLLEMGITATATMDEPVFVSTTMLRDCTSALRKSASYCHIDEPQAQRLFGMLARIDIRQSYVDAVRGSRAMGVWAFNQLKHPSRGGSPWNGSCSVAPSALNVMSSYPWRPVLNADEYAYLQGMRRRIELSRMTLREVKRQGLVFPDESAQPAYAQVSRILIMSGRRAHEAVDAGIADAALAQAFLAALAYKDRFGSYPASLADITTRLGWRLRDDPFSGKALVYKRQKAGFILYSIGADFKDDGGSPQPTWQGGGYMLGKPGDIVWTIKR